MAATRIEFRYTPRDVSSAQRMRFLRSTQLKVILVLWVVSILYITAPLLLPGIFPPGPVNSWALVLQITLAYTVTLGVLLLFTPWADFYLNRFWRLPLLLRFNDKQVHLSVANKPGGLRLPWAKVKKVDENERVFILHYGEGGKFIILPKSIFSKPSDDRRFRDLLSRRALIPISTQDEDEEAA